MLRYVIVEACDAQKTSMPFMFGLQTVPNIPNLLSLRPRLHSLLAYKKLLNLNKFMIFPLLKKL